MALYVQKFGGTSVASLEHIEQVANRVIQARSEGHDIVVVVSAMSGETNRLVSLAKQISEDPDEREYDVLLSSGEIASIALLSMLLNKKGCRARSYTANQIRILTDDLHKKARVVAVETDQLKNDLNAGFVAVVAGFQGINSKGETTTLGRGGSDATAVALAAALNADECQIFTDVDGIFSADPRIVANANQLAEVSYDEMLQMASLGAKVLQNHAVELAVQNNVPLRVASTFTQNPGTLLCHHVARMRSNPVTAIVSKRDIAKLTLKNLSAKPGLIPGVLTALAERNISIDMFVQNATIEGGTLSIVVPQDELILAQSLLNQYTQENTLPAVVTTENVAKLSIVGRGLNSRQQIMTRLFETLSQEGIETLLTSVSEIRISAIICTEQLEKGVQILHNAFEIEST